MTEKVSDKATKSEEGYASWAWFWSWRIVAGIALYVFIFNDKPKKTQTGPPPKVASAAKISSKKAIELVLNEYQQLDGTKVVSTVVSKLRRINTSDCPSEFREAFLSHVHAWERLAEAADSSKQLEKASNSPEIYVESFLRGLAGDPLGTTTEFLNANNDIQNQMKQALSVISSTYNQVELISVKYGVNLPGSN